MDIQGFVRVCMCVYKMFGKVLGGPNNNCSFRPSKSLYFLIQKEKRKYMYLLLNYEQKYLSKCSF